MLDKEKRNQYATTFGGYAFAFAIFFSAFFYAFAVPPASPYTPGATLDPGCVPGSANCTVSILPSGSTGEIQFNASGALSSDTNFFWDNTNKRLGIGTTSPYSMLSVAGQIVGQNFVATSTTATSTFAWGVQANALNVTSTTATSTFANGINVGTGCFAVGGTCVGAASLSGGAANKVAFWTSATTLSNNTNFHWDNTNNRLGLGTTSPYAALSVAGSSGVVANIFTATSTTATSTFSGGMAVGTSGTGLTVLQNGNVGLGTASPTSKLYLTSSNSSPIYFETTATGNSNVITINNTNGGGNAAGIAFQTTSAQRASINAYDTGLNIQTDQNLPISFRINGANLKMILDTTGNFGIGTSTPYSMLSVAGQIVGQNFVATSTTATSTFGGAVGLATTTPWRTLSVSGTVALSGLTTSVTGNAVCITTNKEITDAGAASCVPSSIRFKENINELPLGTALDELRKMSVKTFTYKKEFQMDTQEHIGLIAEDLESIDPRLVVYNTNDGKPWSIHFEELTGLLIQATQALDTRISALEASAGMVKDMTSSWSIDATGKLVVGEIEANKITSKTFCIDDVCIGRDALKELIERNDIPQQSSQQSSLPSLNITGTTTESVTLENPLSTTTQISTATSSEEATSTVMTTQN